MDVNQSERLTSILIPPFKSYLVTEAVQQMRDESKTERNKQTRERSDFFFLRKVINKILDHNSFWQITTQGIRVVWLRRTLPHTQSLITSPPAHTLPPTLLLQDIWWNDKLRWWRCIFFFTVNLALVGENSQGNNRDMKKMWEERLPHFHLESSVNQNIRERKMNGSYSSAGLWNQKWPISELSGVVFFYLLS